MISKFVSKFPFRYKDERKLLTNVVELILKKVFHPIQKETHTRVSQKVSIGQTKRLNRIRKRHEVPYQKVKRKTHNKNKKTRTL